MPKFIKVIFVAVFLTTQFIPNLFVSSQEDQVVYCSIGELLISCVCPEVQSIYYATDSSGKICGCPLPSIVEVVDEVSYCKNKVTQEIGPVQTLDIATLPQTSGGVISIGNSQINSPAISTVSSSSMDTIANILAQKYEISDPYTCGGNFTGKTNNPNAVVVNYVLFNSLTGAKAYELNTAVNTNRTFELAIDYSKILPDTYNVVYYGVNASGQPENPGNSYIANVSNNCAILTSTVDGSDIQNAVTVIAKPTIDAAKGTATIRTGGQDLNRFVVLVVLILSSRVSFCRPIID
jgi:hypothetical protein